MLEVTAPGGGTAAVTETQVPFAEAAKHIADGTERVWHRGAFAIFKSDPHANYYVQVLRKRKKESLYTEAVSNNNLQMQWQLGREQERLLMQMSWLPPDAESSNFHRELPIASGSDLSDLSEMLYQTLVSVYGFADGSDLRITIEEGAFGPAGDAKEPSHANSVRTRPVPAKKSKTWIESWWAYQLVVGVGTLIAIFLPKLLTSDPQAGKFVTAARELVAEYWWVALGLLLSVVVYRVRPWRLVGWHLDRFQQFTVALVVGIGVMQLVVASAPPTQRKPGDQFVVSGYAISVTAAELSLVEKGTPAWDASASSDVRTPAQIAAGDFGYGLGRGVGQAISGGGREEKNYDAWLAVYMTFSVRSDSRPSTPDVEVTLRDEKGYAYGAAERPYKSFGYGPMRPSQLYSERVLFRVFSDARLFVMKIGSNEIAVEPRR